MTSLVATCLDVGSLGDMAPVLAAAGLPVSDPAEPGRAFFRTS